MQDTGQGGDAAGGQATIAPTVPTVPPPTVAPTPTVSPEDQALAQLESLHAASLPRMVLDGRWVAQVASKTVGIDDPLQVAANGTHIFQATDILTEIQSIRSRVGNPSEVLVLQGTDFGKHSVSPDGRPFWITVVDAGFGSSAAVQSWCAGTFSELDATQLANACAPRTLTPPHG